MKQLTENEQLVLSFIKTYAVKRGLLPSVREIAERIGLKSTSGVFYYMSNMEKKGYISKMEGSKRYSVKGLKYIVE